MYKIDYYNEYIEATELITEGSYICTPFQKDASQVFITPNERLGEFITEDSINYNCHLVKVPGVGMSTMMMLEACKNILPGEELIMKPDSSIRLRTLQEGIKSYNERFYGIPDKRLFRLRNVSDVIIANESLEDITNMKDKLTLINSLKEASKRYGLDLGLNEDTGELMIFTEAANNSSNSKRKKIESHILTTMSKLDKTGTNTEFYKNAFKEMTDQQFDKWVRKLIDDPEENLYMEILPYKNEPTLKDIKDGLDYLKVPTNEYVYFRHDENGKELRTRYPVSVGYIQVKRLQQILSKKNTYSTSIKSRNMKTGQVSGDDKIARLLVM